MFDRAKPRASSDNVSAFVALAGPGDSRSDIWTEVGRGLELACCTPPPIGLAAGSAIALALVVAAMLCLPGALP